MKRKVLGSACAALAMGGLLCSVTLAAPQPAPAKPAPNRPKAAPEVQATVPKLKRPAPASDRIDKAVNRLLVQSDQFWHNGDYESVAAMYYVITDLDPTYLEGWQNYGWLMWAGLSRDDAAMRVFLRGLAYHPHTWELYNEIGFLEQHRGRYLSAARWFALATRYNAPRYVWHARAHSLEYAGLVPKAKAMWKTIIAKFPDDPPAPLNLKRLEQGQIRTKPAMGGEQPKGLLPKRSPDTAPDPTLDPNTPLDPNSI